MIHVRTCVLLYGGLGIVGKNSHIHVLVKRDQVWVYLFFNFECVCGSFWSFKRTEWASSFCPFPAVHYLILWQTILPKARFWGNLHLEPSRYMCLMAVTWSVTAVLFIICIALLSSPSPRANRGIIQMWVAYWLWKLLVSALFSPVEWSDGGVCCWPVLW